MPALTQYTPTARSAKANAILALLAGGFVRLFNGAMPADPTIAPAGTMLAEFDLATPAAVEADGVLTFATLETVAIADGTISVGAIYTAAGVRLANFNVGARNTLGFRLELDNPTVQVGSEMDITMTWTEAETDETPSA